MSTAGTMYEETVRYGYAKHLQTQIIPGGTIYPAFTTPFTTGYDTLIFEILATPNAGAINLGSRISFDGGANYLVEDAYWALMQHTFSAPSGGVYGSFYGSQNAGAGYMTYAQHAASPTADWPVFGEIVVKRARPYNTIQGHIVYHHPSVDFISSVGASMYVGTGSSTTNINGIQFFFGNSSFQAGSIIRCYGIKKGVFGS